MLHAVLYVLFGNEKMYENKVVFGILDNAGLVSLFHLLDSSVWLPGILVKETNRIEILELLFFSLFIIYVEVYVKKKKLCIVQKSSVKLASWEFLFQFSFASLFFSRIFFYFFILKKFNSFELIIKLLYFSHMGFLRTRFFFCFKVYLYSVWFMGKWRNV